jgi:hypothetical protein
MPIPAVIISVHMQKSVYELHEIATKVRRDIVRERSRLAVGHCDANRLGTVIR